MAGAYNDDGASYLERSNAQLFKTGGMRSTHLRGRENILKRLVVHIGAFNIGLLLRLLTGMGTPVGRKACMTCITLMTSGATLQVWKVTERELWTTLFMDAFLRPI